MEPQEGDWIYIYGQLRKITKIFDRTFEWNYGWANLDEIEPNDNPDSRVKWIVRKYK